MACKLFAPKYRDTWVAAHFFKERKTCTSAQGDISITVVCQLDWLWYTINGVALIIIILFNAYQAGDMRMHVAEPCSTQKLCKEKK